WLMKNIEFTTESIILGRYQVEGVLGQGAMGTVYAATHIQLGHTVAIKVISNAASEHLFARFKREAKLMAKVRHPSIVQIVDFGMVAENTPCIVMEFVDGEPLGDYLARHRRLHWTKAVKIAIQIADGLAALHAQGIVHRDIKPDNIIYTSARPRHAKLLDFGIARGMQATEEKLTQSGVLIGTPAYMAPEQLLGESASKSSDIYSLGMLLHELLYGELPFGSNTMKEIMIRLRKPAPVPQTSVSDLPIALLSLLFDDLLHMDAESRPTEANKISLALEAILDTHRSQKRETPMAGAVIFKKNRSARKSTGPKAMAPTIDMSSEGEEIPKNENTEPGVSPWPAAPVHQTDPTPPPEIPEDMRALLLVRLPPSTLGKQAERHWLTTLANNHGRAFFYGGQFWICVLTGRSQEHIAGKIAALEQGLQQHYGSLIKSTTRPLPKDFVLSPAHLSGIMPLPMELMEAVSELISA
ncbi:MAG: serine/threonine-protein kinase, partial [Myxococcota bacterium]|nr:serine/threonine-protein kinase [Myxococcota bacterium]